MGRGGVVQVFRGAGARIFSKVGVKGGDRERKGRVLGREGGGWGVEGFGVMGWFVLPLQAMEKLDLYTVVAVACRARLLRRTEEEYRRLLGVATATVAARRDSARDVRMYYDILDGAVDPVLTGDLRELVEGYVAASRLYLELDWGGRAQMASRRRFCRMLYRLYATAGRPLRGEEAARYREKPDDRRLLRAFFPEGPEGEPAASIDWVVLFAFGVARPWSERSRAHDMDDAATRQALERMRELVALLKDDMPRLGSTEKPLALDETLNMLDERLAADDVPDECTPAWMAEMMMDISRACRSLVNMSLLREVGENLQGIYMHGLWVDDADEGRTRFWVFPENRLAAFCYVRDGLGWKVLPYEMRVRFAPDEGYDNSITLITPEGNLDCTLDSSNAMKSWEFFKGTCEGEPDEHGDIVRVELRRQSLDFPAWLDWRAWERLAPGDARHAEFRAVLQQVYDPDSPYSRFLHTVAAEIVDVDNCIVGMDLRYVYAYDYGPARYAMVERGKDLFYYEHAGQAVPRDLPGLDISAARPLYAIPLEVDRELCDTPELARMADVLADAGAITEASIVHSPRLRYPRLVLPQYSAAIDLDPDTMARLGILRYTSLKATRG